LFFFAIAKIRAKAGVSNVQSIPFKILKTSLVIALDNNNLVAHAHSQDGDNFKTEAEAKKSINYALENVDIEDFKKIINQYTSVDQTFVTVIPKDEEKAVLKKITEFKP